MPTQNLHKIFSPSHVAVIGASNTPGKVGHTVLSNLLSGNFRGSIFPVNPRGGTIQGLPAYAALTDLPLIPDLAIVCTPAASVLELVRSCGEVGIRGLIILTAGFRELGQPGAEAEHALLEAAREYPGMRVVGPNCLGVISPAAGLNASFSASMPDAGRIAFISQSGALCTSILDWAQGEGIGFSHFVSVGNMLDVGMDDLIDYFAGDPCTDAILMYVESIVHPRQFMSAARAFTRSKPIIAYKAGRFAESAQAAASHTGAMAGVDAVYEAAFARAGVVRVFDVEDMFDCAELLARQALPKGPHLGIVTNAGGPGVMATDTLLEKQGVLAELAPSTIDTLHECLPAAWSRRNPVDVLGDAPPDRLARATELVLADAGVDAVLVILTPQAMTDPTACAAAVAAAASRSAKPVLTAWMGGPGVQAGRELLNRHGLPTYTTPENAVRAFMNLVQYARNRDMLYETPREITMQLGLERERVARLLAAVLDRREPGNPVLTESESKEVLAAYGIPTNLTLTATSEEAAVERAEQVGYPAVLKVWSDDITHKTDVGGVALNLTDESAVRQAFRRILRSAQATQPTARISGVTVQAMVSIPDSRELILGAKRDPVFGPVMLVGAGGTTAELYQDRSLELPPLSERLARRMLSSLRVWPLLNGFRGRPPVDVEQLVQTLMRLSYLVADHPQITELDINPLLTSPTQCLALDARIVLAAPSAEPVAAERFAHLAIRPYPDEFIRHCTLAGGTQVILRPIRPEDEPAWQAMIGRCSLETIRRRFRCSFQAVPHNFAARYCFIDYDREMAIVAESATEAGTLMGIGRLVADPDHREAEYAVLVADPWQGSGIGSLLTDYCLEISSRWGIDKLRAYVEHHNARMLRMFEHRNFDRVPTPSSDEGEIVFTRQAKPASALPHTR